MSFPFFLKTNPKQQKETLSSALNKLYKKEQNDVLRPEEIDENPFYKHITTHFMSLFSESAYICVPHSKSIRGLPLTKEIIEAHCFQRSPYFCDQLTCTRQKQKSISLDYPVITTASGYKEKRTAHVLAEETVYLGKYRIRVCSIDKLLEGEAPVSDNDPSSETYRISQKKNGYQPGITIPPIRNAKSDLEFLSMFPENLEALNDLQNNLREFVDSYVYIKGYNTCTVERIQQMCMKTHQAILQKNKLIQDACQIPSGHDHFQELVENVVMSYLHKKVWIQTLRPLLRSQDDYLDSICQAYSHVVLSQYSLRYPLSEMHVSCFSEAIKNFQKIETHATTPLEKAAVVKSTLDLISSAVHDSVEQFGHSTSDTSVTSDEMIPLLAFIMVQSGVRRKASLIYYMQHYRLSRPFEGSIYSFMLTTMKSACEFLKDDPLSLYDGAQSTFQAQKQKRAHSTPILPSQRRSHEFNEMDGSVYRYQPRPHILLPHMPACKSPDLMDEWPSYSSSCSSSVSSLDSSRHSLASSEPMISTTFPSLSKSTSLYPNRSRTLSNTRSPPEIIHIPSKRSVSLACKTNGEDLMGDFLKGLTRLDEVACGSAESIKTLHYYHS